VIPINSFKRTTNLGWFNHIEIRVRVNDNPVLVVDDAIEEPQDLNAALSHSFEAAKESHKNEIKMINKQNINNNYWPIKLSHHLKASSFLLNKM